MQEYICEPGMMLYHVTPLNTEENLEVYPHLKNLKEGESYRYSLDQTIFMGITEYFTLYYGNDSAHLEFETIKRMKLLHLGRNKTELIKWSKEKESGKNGYYLVETIENYGYDGWIAYDDERDNFLEICIFNPKDFIKYVRIFDHKKIEIVAPYPENLDESIIRSHTSKINTVIYPYFQDTFITQSIGKYKIRGENIDLKLNVFINDEEIKMNVFLPRNYPLTKLGSSEIINERGIFESLISVLPNDLKTWMEFWEIAKDKMGIYDDDIAFVINTFYIIPKSNDIPLTNEEVNMLKGLGKKILCIGMKIAMEYFGVFGEEKLILLESSGGSVTEKDNLKLQKYTNIDVNKLMKLFKNNFPEAYEYFYEDILDEDSEYIAETLISLENNQKLVEYYKKELDFIQIDPINTEVLMVASTLDFNKKCGY